MKHGVGLGLALVAASACGWVEAADPPARPAPAKTVTSTSTPPAPPVAKPRAPLDLRLGDIRNFMTPDDIQAALKAPEAEANAVVVEGQRVLVPMKKVEDVPPGLASLWYSVKDPKNAWRIFAPVVNAPALQPPLDKIPPPVFRWGP
jgi:hypothetical protein